jgi:hypothetical protein
MSSEISEPESAGALAEPAGPVNTKQNNPEGHDIRARAATEGRPYGVARLVPPHDSRLRQLCVRHPLVAFFILAYAGTWLLHLPIRARPQRHPRLQL